MKIKYEFINEENLLIQKYIGEFSFNDYMDYINIILEKDDWNNVEKILSDFRSIDLDNAINELDKLVNLRKETIKKNYKNVFLTNNPNTTVFAHLYQNSLDRYNYNYCSTIDYAIKILDLKISDKKLENIIDNLKYIV
jgi:aspartyl/asparaginyl-tRNA synthetase